MTTLPNMGLELPVRGAAGAGVWDDTLDANLGKTDAHDHTDGAGVPITTAAIDIDADLSFSSLYAPINLHHITFASIVTTSSLPVKSTFVGNDNELYFRNASGNNVKITAGNTLNVAAFVGGIGGDYTAVGASVSFDDSQKRYTFKDGAANWARGVFGGIRLIDFGTTKATFVGLIAPSSLAASYTLTMPTALPSSTLLVQIDTSGNVLPSNAIANDVTAQAVTLAANKSITVSGTGDYKHGTRTINVPISGGALVAAGSEFGTFSVTIGTGNSYRVPIHLPVGCRIIELRTYIQDLAGGPATTCNLRLGSGAAAGGAVSFSATSATSAGSGLNQLLTATPTAPGIAVVASVYYLAVITRLSGGGNINLIWMEVDYDRP